MMLLTGGGPGHATGLRPPSLAMEMVVTRWVTSDSGRVEELLSQIGGRRPRRILLAAGGDLVLTTCVASAPRTWTLYGRLRYRRAWRLRQRVEIGVTMWSADTGELAVRPLRHRPYLAWSAPRERRYFDVTHQAADRLADLLRPDPVSVPGRRGADAYDLRRTADTSATDALRPPCRSLA
jgi:hypothetical protein